MEPTKQPGSEVKDQSFRTQHKLWKQETAQKKLRLPSPVTDSAPCAHLFRFTALHSASKVGKCIKQSHLISGREDNQKENIMKLVMETAGAYPVEIKASRHEPGLPLYKILLGFSAQHTEKALGREFWTTS